MRSGGTACTSLGEEKPAPWQPTIHSTVKVHQRLMCRDVLEKKGGGVWNPKHCAPKIAQINISRGHSVPANSERFRIVSDFSQLLV